MTVLKESLWYEEILHEGENRGSEKGRDEGRPEKAQSLVLRQLTHRLGAIAPSTETQIRNLSLPQVESLGEALLDFSDRTDLEQWLQENQ